MAHANQVCLYAAKAKVKRVVIASSNHVMGGYKDDGGHGLVRPTDAPRVGTALNDEVAAKQSGDAVAYAAAKLSAEELCRSLADTTTKTAFLALRIGWCQPGANSPSTLSASGCPPEYQTAGEAGKAIAGQETDDNWFKGMWLSNGDFADLFTAAIYSTTVPASGFHVANAMSNNRGGRWSLDETEKLLGIRPKDDVSA